MPGGDLPGGDLPGGDIPTIDEIPDVGEVLPDIPNIDELLPPDVIEDIQQGTTKLIINIQ